MANFFIQIDKPFYFAGDTINGNILVNVMQPIPATGISLKFTGYECVKWNHSQEIVRPHHVEGQPPPPDPIAAIPPHLIFNSDNFNVSDVEEADNRNYDHRPQYIRTSAGRVFRMDYHETRNVFTTVKTMVYSCNGMAPGQYSFPISFKTFEGWPASFDYNTPRKKGRIIYRLAANVEPSNPKFELAHAIEITMRETRRISAATKKSESQITSCCCINKGMSAINVHFEKDGYMQNEDVRMIIEVDNSQCTVDITGITISVTNTVALRSGGSSTSDTYNVFSKVVQGLPAGTRMVGNEAIKEGFKLIANSEIKPTCSGKLLSSFFNLGVQLSYDVACDCCSTMPGVGLPIIIFPNIRAYQLPSTFTTNWAPKMMPICNFVLSNTFENFNINAMSLASGGGNNYPPPPLPPPQNINVAANTLATEMAMQNNMANGMNNAMNANINAMNNQANMMNNQVNITPPGMGGMNVNMNMSGGNVNMGDSRMNVNMGGGNMNMGDSRMNMGGMGGMNMQANMGGANVNMGGMNMQANMGGANVNMGGMNMQTNMGGMNVQTNMGGMNGGMNMNMSGQAMMGGGFERF